MEGNDEEDARRETALAASISFQADSKPSRITEVQLDKLKVHPRPSLLCGGTNFVNFLLMQFKPENLRNMDFSMCCVDSNCIPLKFLGFDLSTYNFSEEIATMAPKS